MSFCPLCEDPVSAELHFLRHADVSGREFAHCQSCDLIFEPSSGHRSLADEKQRYEKHENNLSDLGYRGFLEQAVTPALSLISDRQKGGPKLQALDFGCGPDQVLCEILAAKGISTVGYDLHFFKDTHLLEKKYELIFSTEVWEHFRLPAKEIGLIAGLLQMGALLSVMTSLHQQVFGGDEFFSKWWYVRDFTHLCFYSEKTMEWIALRYGLKILQMKSPVVVFKKV